MTSTSTSGSSRPEQLLRVRVAGLDEDEAQQRHRRAACGIVAKLTGVSAIFTGPPVLCGHRGSGAGEGENTLASFTAALAAGLPWVEVDARLNAGGDLVARHDPTVDDGRFVADLDGAETDALGLLRITDLLEALPPRPASTWRSRPRSRTRCAAARRRPPRASPTCSRGAVHRPLLVTSFDPAALLIVRERLPAVPLGLLTWTRFPLRKAIPAAVHLGVEVVAAHYGAFPLAGKRPRARRAPAGADRRDRPRGRARGDGVVPAAGRGGGARRRRRGLPRRRPLRAGLARGEIARGSPRAAAAALRPAGCRARAASTQHAPERRLETPRTGSMTSTRLGAPSAGTGCGSGCTRPYGDRVEAIGQDAALGDRSPSTISRPVQARCRCAGRSGQGGAPRRRRGS